MKASLWSDLAVIATWTMIAVANCAENLQVAVTTSFALTADLSPWNEGARRTPAAVFSMKVASQNERGFDPMRGPHEWAGRWRIEWTSTLLDRLQSLSQIARQRLCEAGANPAGVLSLVPS